MDFNQRFLQLSDQPSLLPMKQDTIQAVFALLRKKKFLR